MRTGRTPISAARRRRPFATLVDQIQGGESAAAIAEIVEILGLRQEVRMITHVPTGIESLGQPAIDPVCGMEVDPVTSAYRVERGDHVVHFCSAGCRAKFVADPERYAAAGEPVPAPADPKIAGATYTCPMHPQIRRDAPGNCPICGMTLEPLTVTADAPPNHELADMTRRFWVGLAFALPVFVLEMGGHIPQLSLHCVIAPAIAT